MNNTLINVINEKREEIENKMKEACRDALDNKHMQFTVYVKESGKVGIMEDTANSNWTLADCYNGTAIEIATFCYANEEIEEEYEEDIISEFDYDYEIENTLRVLEERGSNE